MVKYPLSKKALHLGLPATAGRRRVRKTLNKKVREQLDGNRAMIRNAKLKPRKSYLRKFK